MKELFYSAAQNPSEDFSHTLNAISKVKLWYLHRKIKTEQEWMSRNRKEECLRREEQPMQRPRGNNSLVLLANNEKSSVDGMNFCRVKRQGPGKRVRLGLEWVQNKKQCQKPSTWENNILSKVLKSKWMQKNSWRPKDQTFKQTQDY